MFVLYSNYRGRKAVSANVISLNFAVLYIVSVHTEEVIHKTMLFHTIHGLLSATC